MKKVRVLGFSLIFALLAASVSAQDVIRMSANLTGGEETPGVLSGSLGTADVEIDAIRRSVTVTLNIFNLPTGSTAGHIHVGPKGVAGPIVLDFSFPTGLTGDLNLRVSLTARDFRPRPTIGIVTLDDAIQAIVGGNAYVNIHTTGFPGGEIRGQLVAR